jgi:hypothetical protein
MVRLPETIRQLIPQFKINRAQVEHLAVMAQVLHCESNSLYESINN